MPYPFLLSYSRKDAKKIEGNTERPDPYFEAFLDRLNQRVMHFTGSTGFVDTESIEFTNRSHRSKERAAGEDMLSELVSFLRPEIVVALGGDAARSSQRIAPTNTVRIRHPSYGGQREFLREMSDLYGQSAPGMKGEHSFVGRRG
jgi:hypothetical protein